MNDRLDDIFGDHVAEGTEPKTLPQDAARGIGPICAGKWGF